MQFHLLQYFLHLVAVPGNNNDNAVVAPALMTISLGRTVATAAGGTVAAAAVAAFVDAARYCNVIGGQG